VYEEDEVKDLQEVVSAVSSTPNQKDIQTEEIEGLTESEFLKIRDAFIPYLKTHRLPEGFTHLEAYKIYLLNHLSLEQRQRLIGNANDNLEADSNASDFPLVMQNSQKKLPYKKKLMEFQERLNPPDPDLRFTFIFDTEEVLRAVNPPWQNVGDLSAYELQLEEGKIVEIMDMRKYLELKGKEARFAGEVYIVLLDNGTKAVWKPRDGYSIRGALGEIIAYKASCWLEKHTHRYLVPPTVLKTYKGHTGSLQWFVESELDLWLDEQRALGYKNLDTEDLANGSAFLKIFGQWDVHPGNYMMPKGADRRTVLALIDNECVVNRKYSPDDSKERPYVRHSHSQVLEDQGNHAAPPVFIKLQIPTQEQLAMELQDFRLPGTKLNNLFKALGNGRVPISVMIWKYSLWVQYHQYNEKAFPNHVDSSPEWLLEAYSKLTEKDVKEIFSLGIEAFPEHFNEDFLQEILDRCNQFLQKAPILGRAFCLN